MEKLREQQGQEFQDGTPGVDPVSVHDRHHEIPEKNEEKKVNSRDSCQCQAGQNGWHNQNSAVSAAFIKVSQGQETVDEQCHCSC